MVVKLARSTYGYGYDVIGNQSAAPGGVSYT